MEVSNQPESVWMTWRGEKSFPYHSLNPNSLLVHPVSSHYTDWAIPAPFQVHIQTQNGTSLILFLLFFRKKYHMKFLPFDMGHTSQFSKQSPWIIVSLLYCRLWCFRWYVVFWVTRPYCLVEADGWQWIPLGHLCSFQMTWCHTPETANMKSLFWWLIWILLSSNITWIS
jgi:hypothetical protein